MSALSDSSRETEAVLGKYRRTCRVERMMALRGAGGFSGAALWKLETSAGPCCLRRWPAEHPTADRLAWIHRVLIHVDEQGFRLVPVPLRTDEGETFVNGFGLLWELMSWLPGAADYLTRRNVRRLSAAMAALARFHLAAATFSRTHHVHGRSPGIGERQTRLRNLLAGELNEVLAAVSHHEWEELRSRAQKLRALFRITGPGVLAMLDQASTIEIPLAPAIRDIHDEHVLFAGDEVTGLVDFGAMRIESRVADVARLLDSMAADDEAAWNVGLDAYARVAPLSIDEEALLRPLDASAVLLSPLNWLDWIGRQRRQFTEPARVLARIDRHLRRLERLADTAKFS